MKSLILLLLSMVVGFSCERAYNQKSKGTAERGIDTNEYKVCLRILSSDSMQGRSPGTPGGNKAANYIASQFGRYGLTPISEEEGYLQQVDIESFQPVYKTADVAISGTNFEEKIKPFEEILLISRQNKPSVSIEGELVFAGYGCVAPEYNWDDYKDIEVKDKIVVCLINHPDFQSPDYRAGQTTYYGTFHYKSEIAFRKGARGILFIFQKDGLFSFRGWQNYITNMSFGEHSNDLKIPLTAFITEEAFERVIRKENLTTNDLVKKAQSRDFKPFPMDAHLQTSFEQTVKRFTSSNVIGIVKGAKNPEQAIIYMAHYDHLGMLRPENGDSIYNGAIDNASGTAGIINLAGYFSDHPADRSVIFLATTAEEMGFQGVQHYLNNPVIPLTETIVGINLDMMNFMGKTDMLTIRPLSYTDAVDTVKKIAEKQNIRLDLDDFDSSYLSFRVESYPFALHDILTLNLVFEWTNRNPSSLSVEQLNEIINSGGVNYHTPFDDIKAWFRYDGILQELELAKEIGLYYASKGLKPTFNNDNPFIPAKKMWMSKAF